MGLEYLGVLVISITPVYMFGLRGITLVLISALGSAGLCHRLGRASRAASSPNFTRPVPQSPSRYALYPSQTDAKWSRKHTGQEGRRVFEGRSEERRVGKECRWTGDWSSDVCSSDLVASHLSSYPLLALLAFVIGLAARVELRPPPILPARFPNRPRDTRYIRRRPMQNGVGSTQGRKAGGYSKEDRKSVV